MFLPALKKIPLAVKIFAGFVAVLALVTIGNIIFYYQFSKVSDINRESANTFYRMSQAKNIREQMDEMITYFRLLTTMDLSSIDEEKQRTAKIVDDLIAKSIKAKKKSNDSKLDNLENAIKDFDDNRKNYYEKLDNQRLKLAYRILNSEILKEQYTYIRSLIKRIPNEKISQHEYYVDDLQRLMKQSYYIARIEKPQNMIPHVWDSIYSIRPRGDDAEELFLDIDHQLDTLRLWDIPKMLAKSDNEDSLIAYMIDFIDEIDSTFSILASEERQIMASLISETSYRQKKTGKFIIYGSIAFTLLSLIVAIYLANRIASPLQRLRSATYRASLGKYHQSLEITTRDEIGGLVEDFNSMMEALSRLDEMKSHFMASITHDLKSPLNRIKQRMANIEDGMYGDVPKWLFEQIQLFLKDVDTLFNLVHNHLDIQKIESGKFVLNIQPNEIKPFLRQSVSKHIVSYQAKGVGLYLKIDLDEQSVLFDSEHMSRVFDNLLTNCLKYSTRGDTVRVIASMEKDMIIISISDEGPGIPDSMKPYIFDKFYQVPGEKKKGSGLGLTITKQIIEEHGGWIKVMDNKPKGSKFLFTIPVNHNE
ncbi:MAG: ATP-binding protein [Candidatus Zixiibacteriota bacterium]